MKSLKTFFLKSVYSILAIVVALVFFRLYTHKSFLDWFPLFSIHFFAVLTCIWSSNKSGYFEKLKIWFKAYIVGIVAMLLTSFAFLLVWKLTNNFNFIYRQFTAAIIGITAAEVVALSLLRKKDQVLLESKEAPSDYQKYLKEVEDILYAERAIIDSVDFKLVSEYVLKLIKSDPIRFEKSIKDDRPLQNLIYSIMANRLADLIETGRFHVYRGVLSSSGEDMLARYDRYVDKNVSLGDLNEDEAKRIKQSLRNEINKMG